MEQGGKLFVAALKHIQIYKGVYSSKTTTISELPEDPLARTFQPGLAPDITDPQRIIAKFIL